MAAVDLVADFLSRGRHAFTTADARAWLGVGPTAARVALARLLARKAIVSPFRGYYVIVPPEYRALGCLPGEQFVPTYLESRGTAYYVALLSAARLHGAGHQAAQVFQVMVEKSRRPVACGRVRVQFVARRGVREVPAMAAQTDRGTMRVSTREATLLDLVGFPRHAGGLDNVATIVRELFGELDGGLLAAAAAHAPIAWAQRLGYLLELLGARPQVTDPLAKVVRERSKAYAALSTRVRARGQARNTRWRILVNTEVHPEA
jgi:predicted transcriptional regulator of viral defense system